MGIHILNYLEDWFILAQSKDELLSHRSFLLSHLECLGVRVNFAKSALSPSQWISFLGTVLDSAQMRAVVALAIQQLMTSFKIGAPRPLKAFNHLADAFIQSDVQMRRAIEAIRPSREQQYTSAMTSLR